MVHMSTLLPSSFRAYSPLTCTSQLGWLTWCYVSAYFPPLSCLFFLCFCLFSLSPHAFGLQSSHLQQINFVPQSDLTCVRTPECTELVIQSNKKANWGWQNAEQQPANWLRAGEWIGGGGCGGGESGVECGEGGEHFGDSLASVRVLQSHPSSLFLWD